MNSDQETESPEMCSEESTHTVKESVEKLFSLINTEFSRSSVQMKKKTLAYSNKYVKQKPTY